MLKIIIPLAGSSDMFQNAGYTYPKPLIEVKGKPMIERVVDQLKDLKETYKVVFIIKEEDSNKYHLHNTLKLIEPSCEIIRLKKETKGGLCSVLMSIDVIEDNDSILIINGDQVIEKGFNIFMDFWKNHISDAGVVDFYSIHPRWSYAITNGINVIQTAEKNPISHHAIAGYYYFKNAQLFFESAFRVILDDVRINDMFFISSVLNQYILRGLNVHHYEIDKGEYSSFYSPNKITEFESKLI